MTKIYSDKKWLMPGQSHEVILAPFWGIPPHDEADPARSRFDAFAKVGKEFFKLTTLSECDAAVLPGPYVPKSPVAHALAHEAKKYGKKAVVFFNSDSTEDIPIKNSIIFRTSSYRRTKKPNEYALPAWSEDFVEKYYDGQLHIREKQDVPTIGYCGQLTYRIPNTQHQMKQMIRHPLQTFKTFQVPKIYRNTNIRERAIKILESPLFSPLKRGVACPSAMSSGPNGRRASSGRPGTMQEGGVGHSTTSRGTKPRSSPMNTPSPLLGGGVREPYIKTNFLIRNSFWGGALINGKLDKNQALRVRQEYVENMIQSDYVLCTRGSGNFSYRLYETLSCGQIPLFIDTDCVLPYEEYIDWKKVCVWVDAKELNQLPDKIKSFHESLSPDEFIERQKQCRHIWEEWLSPQGFFKNLYRVILKKNAHDYAKTVKI